MYVHECSRRNIQPEQKNYNLSAHKVTIAANTGEQ